MINGITEQWIQLSSPLPNINLSHSVILDKCNECANYKRSENSTVNMISSIAS